jgi:hypothetical protein
MERPALAFDVLRIKTPQLVGIVAGCVVFAVTILTVLYLLYASGAIDGFLAEMQAGARRHVPTCTHMHAQASHLSLPT